MSASLLVVGSVAFDTIETRAGKREEILGGAATFIALAASHFCPVNLVAVVGKQDFPAKHTELLAARGIDLEGLERAPGRTFRWSGVYAEDFSSRRTLDTQLGVFEAFDPKVPKPYLQSRVVMLGNIHPEDSKRPSAETILSRVRPRLRPGSILIFHDGGWRPGVDRTPTVEAVDRLTDECLETGWRFRRLRELIEPKPPGV